MFKSPEGKRFPINVSTTVTVTDDTKATKVKPLWNVWGEFQLNEK